MTEQSPASPTSRGMLSELIGEPPRPEKKSVVREWVASLSIEDSEWFHAQLKDRRWSDVALSDRLTRAEVPFGRNALRMYRKEFLNNAQ